VIGQPGTPAAAALSGIASRLAAVPRGLAGMKLGLQPR
jgi:ATP-binding protein involved in chromosome partitioning